MKGNPTAGIILLLAASLLIALGTSYGDRVRAAFGILFGTSSGGAKPSEDTHKGGNRYDDNQSGGVRA